MTHAAGTGGLSFFASPPLTALSLALRLVVARGWAAPHLGNSWMTAPGSSASRPNGFKGRPAGGTWQGGQPISRDRSHLWLFSWGSTSVLNDGVCTGQRSRGFTNGQHSQSGRDGRLRLPGRAMVTPHRSSVLYAGMLAASSSGSSSTPSAAGAASGAGGKGKGVGGGENGLNIDVDVDGDETGSRTTVSAATPRSSRAACDQGDVKQKVKPSKTKAGSSSSSSSPSASSSASASGVSGSSGGRKLLRLSKLLADRAIGSRSEVDALVRRGRVKVDGAVVRSPKIKLPVDCVIEVNGQECGPVPLLVAFHKPKGVITTLSDDWDREDLSDVLPRSLLLRHHPVGRLDADSSGLLLLSSDGALTHRLLNPRFEVEREYVATVDVADRAAGEPGKELVAALREGVPTADGVYKADVAGIDGRDVRVVVREGKNRMVRRMLANAGYPVLELRRERYGNILLGELPEGDHAPVSGEALEWAKSVFQLQPAVGDGGEENGMALL